MHDWPPLVSTATVLDALWTKHQLDHCSVLHARGTLAQSSCYQPKRALKTDQWKPPCANHVAMHRHGHRFGRYLGPPSAEPQLCNALAKQTRSHELMYAKDSSQNGPQ